MKKLFIAASLVFASIFANAQDDGDGGMKPTSGDVTAEFGFAGGLDDIDLGLNNGNIRLRYFLSDELAARLGVNLTREAITRVVSTNPASEIKARYSQVILNLGVQKNFDGTERLLPYVGADLLFSLTGVREEGENYNVTTDAAEAGSSYEIKGSTSEIALSSFSVPTTTNAGTGLGLRIVAGADFYFAKQVFLGGEFGWGILVNSERDLESSVTIGGTTTSTTTDRGKTSTLTPSVIGNVRIGFVF